MTDDAHAPPPETILFVEDEAVIRMDMAEFLRECGYQVHEAANANEVGVIAGPNECNCNDMVSHHLNVIFPPGLRVKN